MFFLLMLIGTLIIFRRPNLLFGIRRKFSLELKYAGVWMLISFIFVTNKTVGSKSSKIIVSVIYLSRTTIILKWRQKILVNRMIYLIQKIKLLILVWVYMNIIRNPKQFTINTKIIYHLKKWVLVDHRFTRWNYVFALLQ